MRLLQANLLFFLISMSHFNIHRVFNFQIRNKETHQCLDSMGRKSGEKLGMVGCHNMGGNQVCITQLSPLDTSM